jgi:LPXTG-motif cell wall-anchored protein
MFRNQRRILSTTLTGIAVGGSMLGLFGHMGATGSAQASLLQQTTTSALVYGVTTENNIISFRSDAPGTLLSRVGMTGTQAGETIVGIDFRPANPDQLWALGSTSRLYVVDPMSGVASVSPVTATTFLTPLNGTDFGFDFNPTVDRIRVTSDSDQNLRLNPLTGGVAAVDGTLAYTSTDRNASANPAIVGSAYTNSFSGTTSTLLYNIDAGLDVLVTQNPPNAGTLNTVGALGVDASGLTGFDILSAGGANSAYAVMVASNAKSALYTIDLTSGAATLVGAVGGSGSVNLSATELVRGIAVQQAPAGGAAPTTTVTAQPTQAASTPTTAASPTSMPTTAPPTVAPPPPTIAALPTTPPAPATPIATPSTPPGMPRTGTPNDIMFYVIGALSLIIGSAGLLLKRRSRLS